MAKMGLSRSTTFFGPPIIRQKPRSSPHTPVEALRRLQAGDRSIPAGRIFGPDVLVIADEAAAGALVP